MMQHNHWSPYTQRALVMLVLWALIVTEPALAHHMAPGERPANFVQGLLSGLGHPLIGWDHSLFLLAIALVAAAIDRVLLLPAAFVLLVPVGVIQPLPLASVPGGAWLPAVSVGAMAALFLIREHLPSLLAVGLAILAGLAHGSAHAQAIVGAETTPLAAYLIGLSIIQAGVIVTIAMTTRRFLARTEAATNYQSDKRQAGPASSAGTRYQRAPGGHSKT